MEAVHGRLPLEAIQPESSFEVESFNLKLLPVSTELTGAFHTSPVITCEPLENALNTFSFDSALFSSGVSIGNHLVAFLDAFLETAYRYTFTSLSDRRRLIVNWSVYFFQLETFKLVII